MSITLAFDGPAQLVGDNLDLTVNLGNIGCHESNKAVWQFLCTGDGEVHFYVTGLTGFDANYETNEMPVSCIDLGCPIWIDKSP